MRRLFAATLLGLLLCATLLWPASQQGIAQAQWPGEALLWRGQTPVTQTAQYRGLSTIGADYVYLFYDTGLASETGTAAITVTRQWRGNVYETLTATGEVSTTQQATGVITVASASPYYPDLQVEVYVDTGTITPTIAVVAQ